MKWNWKGILGAWLIDIVGSQIVGIVVAIPLAIWLVARGTASQNIASMLTAMPIFLVLALVFGLAMDALAGYLAAKWARQNPMAHSVVAGGLSMISGLLLSVGSTTPSYFRFSSLLVVPAAALGGWFFLRTAAKSRSKSAIPNGEIADSAESIAPIAAP